jgi:hypothetical protein
MLFEKQQIITKLDAMEDGDVFIIIKHGDEFTLIDVDKQKPVGKHAKPEE